MILAIATKIPSCFLGSQLTSLAAVGTTKIPQNASPPTVGQSICSLLKLRRNPALTDTTTINSAEETVPIMLRGSVCVVARSVGVTTGPHPSPPDASIDPP